MQPANDQPAPPATASHRWSLAFDLAALSCVLTVATTARLVFLSSDPPIFLTTDSLTYALPAAQLAQGEGFDLSLRRTPGYPLFVAGFLALSGDDFRPLLYGQHLLGVATAGLTWLLGRLTFGRLAGLLGGLATALSGPQIIYEHYLMTEALFTLLLVGSLLALVAALRADRRRLYLLTGLLFGLCALTRPIGQIFPLLAPIAVLLHGRWDGPWRPRLRRAARASAIVLLGFALVVLPWMARNRVVGGELTGSAALGKTLFGRITRHDEGLRFDLAPAGPPETDPRRAEARAVARRAAQEDTSRGSLVHERLRREFGLSEAQAYNVMRDVALEVLLAQPGYYVRSSLQAGSELFLGQVEPLRTHLERLANNRLRRDWQQSPTLAPLLPAPVPPEVRWERMEQATGLVRLYEPSSRENGPLLGLLFLLGTAATLARPAWRQALVLPLVSLTVLVLSAFLDGPVPRFRYPLDPLIALVAAAGLVAAADAARALVARGLGRPRAPDGRPAEPAVARGASPDQPAAATPRLSVGAPSAPRGGAVAPTVDGAGRD